MTPAPTRRQWSTTATIALVTHLIASVTLVLLTAEVDVPGWFVLLNAIAYVIAVTHLCRLGLRFLGANA
jgi:hypothetical protein